jgi:hypothetical protein
MDGRHSGTGRTKADELAYLRLAAQCEHMQRILLGAVDNKEFQ